MLCHLVKVPLKELKFGWTHLVSIVRRRKTCLVSWRLKCLENWKRDWERSRVSRWRKGRWEASGVLNCSGHSRIRYSGALVQGRRNTARGPIPYVVNSEHFSLSFIFHTFIRPYARSFSPLVFPYSFPTLLGRLAWFVNDHPRMLACSKSRGSFSQPDVGTPEN